jgi:hypothetical protein
MLFRFLPKTAAIVSEKNSELKCTLAFCVDEIELGEEFDKLPLHGTVAPPFFITEDKLYDLVLGYYNLISPWSSFLYDDGEATVMQADREASAFGLPEHPIPARRISPINPVEKDDFLKLREWIKERTEEVCGEDSTKDWVLGELHVSEGEHDLTVLEGPFTVNALVLFVKRESKWRAEEDFIWNN